MEMTADIPAMKVSLKHLDDISKIHKDPFSAIAELSDNVYDVKASDLIIDKEEIGGKTCLVIQDNGTGLSRSQMHNILNLGFSDKDQTKNKIHSPIGFRGTGFHSGSLRLGRDVLVLTKQTKRAGVGFLSRTYLEALKSDAVFVPSLNYSFPDYNVYDVKASDLIIDKEEIGVHLKKKEKNRKCLKAILNHSIFKKEKDLIAEFDKIKSESGTRIIIYNLKNLPNGTLELDFSQDLTDIKSRDLTEIKNKRPSKYKTSLKAYLSILYLWPRMNIILRGRPVETKIISKQLAHTETHDYTPKNTGSKTVKITVGFRCEDHDSEDYGMMIYYKNRLIKAFEKVGYQKQPKGKGVGIIGVVDVDFLQLTQNKQDFNSTDSYRNLMETCDEKFNIYWNGNNDLLQNGLQNLKPDTLWINCDQCRKWRRLPKDTNRSSLPEKWLCTMNKDSIHNECDDPEEPEDREIINNRSTNVKQNERKTTSRKSMKNEKRSPKSSRQEPTVQPEVSRKMPAEIPASILDQDSINEEVESLSRPTPLKRIARPSDQSLDGISDEDDNSLSHPSPSKRIKRPSNQSQDGMSDDEDKSLRWPSPSKRIARPSDQSLDVMCDDKDNSLRWPSPSKRIARPSEKSQDGMSEEDNILTYLSLPTKIARTAELASNSGMKAIEKNRDNIRKQDKSTDSRKRICTTKEGISSKFQTFSACQLSTSNSLEDGNEGSSKRKFHHLLCLIYPHEDIGDIDNIDKTVEDMIKRLTSRIDCSDKESTACGNDNSNAGDCRVNAKKFNIGNECIVLTADGRNEENCFLLDKDSDNEDDCIVLDKESDNEEDCIDKDSDNEEDCVVIDKDSDNEEDCIDKDSDNEEDCIDKDSDNEEDCVAIDKDSDNEEDSNVLDKDGDNEEEDCIMLNKVSRDEEECNYQEKCYNNDNESIYSDKKENNYHALRNSRVPIHNEDNSYNTVVYETEEVGSGEVVYHRNDSVDNNEGKYYGEDSVDIDGHDFHRNDSVDNNEGKYYEEDSVDIDGDDYHRNDSVDNNKGKYYEEDSVDIDGDDYHRNDSVDNNEGKYYEEDSVDIDGDDYHRNDSVDNNEGKYYEEDSVDIDGDDYHRNDSVDNNEGKYYEEDSVDIDGHYFHRNDSVDNNEGKYYEEDSVDIDGDDYHRNDSVDNNEGKYYEEDSVDIDGHYFHRNDSVDNNEGKYYEEDSVDIDGDDYHRNDSVDNNEGKYYEEDSVDIEGDKYRDEVYGYYYTKESVGIVEENYTEQESSNGQWLDYQNQESSINWEWED